MTDRVTGGFDVQDLARDKFRRGPGHAVRTLQMMVHDEAQIVAVHMRGIKRSRSSISGMVSNSERVRSHRRK